jgi:Rad3-related DNA helicase
VDGSRPGAAVTVPEGAAPPGADGDLVLLGGGAGIAVAGRLWGRGLDLVVQARTGTGKTAAFGLPIVDVVVKKSLAKVQVVVLSPTRELALQITRELEALGKHRGTKIAPV